MSVGPRLILPNLLEKPSVPSVDTQRRSDPGCVVGGFETQSLLKCIRVQVRPGPIRNASTPEWRGGFDHVALEVLTKTSELSSLVVRSLSVRDVCVRVPV